MITKFHDNQDDYQMITKLPNSISERLLKNSSNQEIFNTAKVE